MREKLVEHDPGIVECVQSIAKESEIKRTGRNSNKNSCAEMLMMTD